MSNALHDYARLFERYAASNGGTGVYLAGEDCLSLANEMRMDADAIAAENAKLRELCEMFAEYVSQDRCEGCVVKRRCNEGDIEECWQRAEIRKVASELRIEVDE